RIRLSSRTADMVAWTGEGDSFPLIEPRFYLPYGSQSYWAPGWGYWGLLGGMHGNPAADVGQAIEPPKDHPVREALRLYEQANRTKDFDGQAQLFQEIQRIASENVFTINIAESPPQLVVTDANLRNVPENAVYAYIYTSPGNTGLETYFFDPATVLPDKAAASNALMDSLINPTLRPGGESLAAEASSFSVWPYLRLLLVLALSGGLLVLGLQKPFIGGRLLLMVPTLLVLSVLVFAIIQAPPGDYLQTRMMELEEQGSISAQEQVEELRETFHLDEPVWRQYFRWVGLTWFVTFEASDTGLLQGNLGRSMATSQPVNFVVGDRLMLTVLISVGTILFTWSLALPIGVYSAVKQYSVGDYVLTFVGFLGMCVPSFLFALVLMTLAGVSGLFSAEYAAQPFWDLAKVGDLLKHVWVPVLVLGVGGTASMIRVMRANLLDELSKPYVVTARAKGVRPTKLLIKYPVRLALNPFVSSIGGLFPQLVSGGAVVAMVLSLPTVGPLLLDALLLEDMYLAGSMLMVLSLLGIIGTLVSDLLLLWLDPRIRFEGGAR
ncbi:MAG: ABC transporter permease, partial [Planctomycetota bacterium]